MACKLKSVPPEFEATAGEKVTLTLKDHIGIALIASAEYGGNQLVPPRQAIATIHFDVIKGAKSLKVVFVFTASTAGRSELREECAGGESQLIRDIGGSEPFQLFRIVGK